MMNEIQIYGPKIEDTETIARIIVRSLPDKFPSVFNKISEQKYVRVLDLIFKDMVKIISFTGIIIAKQKSNILGSMLIKHRTMEKYPKKRGLKIMKKELGHWKAFNNFLYHDFLKYNYKKDLLKIDTLAVDENSRRMGIGTTLLKYAQKYVKELGLKYMKLTVLKSNHIAIRLYEKFGFKIKFKRRRLINKLFPRLPIYFIMQYKIFNLNKGQ